MGSAGLPVNYRTIKRKRLPVFLALLALLAGALILLNITIFPFFGWQDLFYYTISRLTPASWSELEGRPWNLQAVLSAEGTALWWPDPPGSIWFELSNENIRGYVACNEFTGRYWSSPGDHTFAVNGIFQALVNCPPPGAQQGGAFRRALETAESYSLAGDELRIFCAGGTQVLLLSR